nr:unnamed protein product [Callosobruchus analis]
MDPYEKEIARLRALYEEVLADEAAGLMENDTLGNEEAQDSDGSIDGEDNVIFSDHDKARVFEDADPRLYYYGKDGTKWKKTAPPKNIRTRSENIVSHLPGPIREGKQATTPMSSWNALFGNIIPLVVKYTNIYIEQISDKFKNQSDTRITTCAEIRAFIGLLYLAGTDHGSRKNLDEFWAQDGLGSELFIATMSQRRFRFLLRVLRFDDKRTRVERSELDKLAPVREVFELFTENCKQSYAVFATVDSRTFYTSHLEIYAGVQPDGPYRLDNSTEAVTLRMCQHLSGTGRNITMDGWFTGCSVVNKLLTQHRLTVVGTIKTNKREIPTRRLFIKSLGKEMVSEYMSTRMSTSGLHTYIQNAIHKYCSITPEAQPGPSRGNRESVNTVQSARLVNRATFASAAFV